MVQCKFLFVLNPERCLLQVFRWKEEEKRFHFRTSDVGRGVLMQLLRNLQTNAAALEQMASGVRDEANIARVGLYKGTRTQSVDL